MTEHAVTLDDCANCGAMRYCDAHITGGPWPHRGGPNPCKVIVGSQQQERGGNGSISNQKE